MDRVVLRRCLIGMTGMLLLAFGAPVVAEDAIVPQVPSRLSLTEAVRISLQHNTSLKQQNVSYLAARSAVASARDLTTTTLVAGLSEQSVGSGEKQTSASLASVISWQRPSGASLSATVVPAASSNSTSTLSLTYRRPLISQSGRTSATGRSLLNTDYDLASAENQLYLARQSTTEDTLQRYFSAVRARELINVSETDVEIAKETVRAARRKLEEGLVAQIEVSQAEIQLAQSEDSLIAQKRAYRDALDSLLLQMGLKVGQTTELTDTAPEERGALDSTALAEEAEKNRKDLRVLDISIERQQLALDVSKDQLRPTLNAVGDYTKAGIGVGGGSQFSSEGYWSAGLEYSLPVGNTPLKENRAMAQRNLTQLLADREYQRQQVKNEVLAAVRRVEATAASIDIYQENVKVAEANLTLARRMVEEGLRLNRDLLDAQVALTRTRSSLLSAKIEHYLARMTLLRALGRDLAQEIGG